MSPTRVIIPTNRLKFTTRIFGTREEAEAFALTIADKKPILQDATEKVPSQGQSAMGRNRGYKKNTCYCGRTKENGRCLNHQLITAESSK